MSDEKQTQTVVTALQYSLRKTGTSSQLQLPFDLTQPYVKIVAPHHGKLTYLVKLESITNRDEPADDLVIPESILKFLPFIVPRKRRDDVIGDLTEDFLTYGAHYGRSYAVWLLRWELAALCWHRFGPTALIVGVGAWFRKKIGL